MGGKIITFGDLESEKRKFHHLKNLTSLDNLGIDNILISFPYIVLFPPVKKIIYSKKN